MPDVLVQGLPLWGGALAMVLGAIVAGNGYGWGTWKTMFTQGPSRTSSVGGSMLALVIIEVGVMVMTLALMTVVSLAIAAGESQPIDWPSLGVLLKSAGGGLLVLEMWALMGYALGTLARGPALSVGLGLVWALVVENLLRGVGSLLGPIESVTHVLPGTSARLADRGDRRRRGQPHRHPRRARHRGRGAGAAHRAGVRRGAARDRRTAGAAAGRHLRLPSPRSTTRWGNRSRCLDTARASTCSATTRSRRR